jgi:hypothetical protein
MTNIPVSGEAQMWPNYEDFRPEPSFDDNLSEDVVRALAASGINVSIPLVIRETLINALPTNAQTGTTVSD